MAAASYILDATDDRMTRDCSVFLLLVVCLCFCKLLWLLSFAVAVSLNEFFVVCIIVFVIIYSSFISDYFSVCLSVSCSWALGSFPQCNRLVVKQ
jgi:hypothetical protein